MSIAATDELLEVISKLRGLFPDWRMGQLIANLARQGGTDVGAIWDIEDAELLTAARRLIDRNRGRRGDDADSVS